MEIADIIRSVPQHIAEGIALGKAQQSNRPYRHIICCGMGGSAIAGEILSMVKDDVIVHWDYDLPSMAGAQDLVICTSWSGNTEETISSYQKARERGLDTLVITTGGQLAQLAQDQHSPFIILPSNSIPPRMAAGYMTGALFASLSMESSLPTALDVTPLEQQGRALADSLTGRMPVIYTSYPWRRLTGFWKMIYSETAKRQVMVNWFPSGAHTEVVGWEGPYQDTVAFIILQDSAENPRYTSNSKALLAIASEKGYTTSIIQLSGNTILEQVFNNYILALWTSAYAAQALHIDPIATELLDEFKKLKAQS